MVGGVKFFPGKLDDLFTGSEMEKATERWARTIARSSEATHLAGADRRNSVHPGKPGRDAEGVYGTVVNDDPGWHLIEYGTIHQSPNPQMRHAVEAAGARWVDDGPDA